MTGAVQHNHWTQVARAYLVDATIVVVSFLVGTLLRFGMEWAGDDEAFIAQYWEAFDEYWPGMILSALFFPSCVYVCGLYTPKSFHTEILKRFLMLAGCQGLTILVLLAYFSIDFSAKIGRGVMFYAMAVCTLMVMLHHINTTVRRRNYRERCAILNMPQMDTFTEDMIQRFIGPDLKFCGFVLQKDDINKFKPIEYLAVLGTMEQLEDIAKSHEISKVICNAEDLADERYYRHLCNLRYSGIDVVTVLQHCEEIHQYVPLHLASNEWLVSASSTPHRLYIRKIKRGSDIAFSLLMLLLASPIILLASIGVLLTSGKPILYKQDRVGRFGRVFQVAKFRTMRNDAEKDGAQWSSADGDSRVTPLGGFMRKYRIDELPQLMNILKGDMSFVGPRPERPEFVEMLNKKLPMNPERLMIQPGLTGWAQVNYPYGSSVDDAARKLEYDLYYMKHMSLFLDIFIILDTVRTVLNGGARIEEALRHNRYFLAALKVRGETTP
jgi:exopolysaccharide biosynthesis polyprenyl glycosylphosphotransferase